jgi:two-component system alkaline phosphatase synthesis response regulator PhoP
MTETQKNLKILLVDDDKFLLDMYLLKFKKSGLEIDTASNGISALEKIKANSDYDMVLMDIIMPGMDGLELLKKIRDEKLLPKAVVIMLTNQADDEDKAKAIGVDGYIIKATMIPSEVVDKVLEIYKNKKK